MIAHIYAAAWPSREKRERRREAEIKAERKEEEEAAKDVTGPT